MRVNSGFSLALAGFALLSCGDAVIKSIAGAWPAPAVAALRFWISVPFLAFLIAHSGGKAAFAVRKPWVQFGRGAALAGSSCLFFLSLFAMPMTDATAIVFVNPIITAILSAVFLKEKMRASAWLASLLALAGVAFVLRPNLLEMGPSALLPLGAAFCFSIMMILNRQAAGTGNAWTLQWIMASVAAIMCTLFAFAGHISDVPALQVQMPPLDIIVRCALVALTATMSHWLIYLGTTRDTAAITAQAVYIQLPVALLIDGIVFAHLPDRSALVGATLIICAGCIIWLNQRRTGGAVR